jgi:small subunit ribosomal protein S2
MPDLGLRDLLEAGVHFGHQTRKWEPRMKPYIFIARGGIYIIDLQKTLQALHKATDFLRQLAAKGGTVLFVGTKKQAKVAIKQFAAQCGMPYVIERWLGGMLTNYATIFKSVQRLEEYEAMMADGRMGNFSKKEQLEINRNYEKLMRNLGGIRHMKGLPDALFVIDTNEELTAVREANKLGIPVVGIVDTNCNPEIITHPIPGNDDAIRSITLFARTVAEAIKDGQTIKAEGRQDEVEILQDTESAGAPTASLSSDESTVEEAAAASRPAKEDTKSPEPALENTAGGVAPTPTDGERSEASSE